ncbi:hypothetical protein ACHAPT_008729 [Fusarium lateritium]
MPATSENDLFYAVLASILVNRYPVPYIIGWRGADKMCWPLLSEEPQCANILLSHLPRNKFGPKSENGNTVYSDARSATVEETYDPEFKYRLPDQIYLARLFAPQEISRAGQIEDRAIPNLREALVSPTPETTKNVTEYHVAIDYDCAFVQTGCYSHRWMHKPNYNNSDNTATMTRDLFDQEKNSRPYPIQMPANVYQSLVRIFDSLPERSMSARGWIGSLKLDTNVVPRSIFGFYHVTCSKRDLIKDFKSYWFHPLIEPLLKGLLPRDPGWYRHHREAH